MSVNYLLKRTSTADKRPTAAQLDIGELAINYEGGDPGLYFEDSNGAVRKIGPVTVGGTAPNASPAGQSGNSIGELWLDNSGGDNVLKVWDGSAWQTAASNSGTAAGSDTQIQFNNSGVLGGDANFTFDADNDILSVTTMAGDLNGAVVFTAQADQNLTKGQVVYISGISGNTPTVDLARANSSSTMPAYGIVDADISSGSTGKIVTFGQATNLDTSTPGFSEGETLYVSSTSAGELVNTPPTGESSLIQNIGRVERVSSTVGRIVVGGAGRTNATPNLDDGKIFIGNGSNQAVSSTLTDALSAQAGISSAADAVAVTIDSSERIGIGTTAPNAKVDITGDGANSSRVFIGQSNDTADGADVTGYRSRGTQASPTALQSGDAIFKLFAQAHNGTSYLAAGNMGWAASDGSGNSTFSLKTRSGSAVGDRLTIDSSGDTSLTGSLSVNNELTVGSVGSPFQASATNDVVTKSYGDVAYVIQSELAADISSELGLTRTAGTGTVIDIDTASVNLQKDLAFANASDIAFIDNTTDALQFTDEIGNAYITFNSTDDAECVKFHKKLCLDADTQVDMSGSTVITLLDNDFDALDIKEGNNLYMRFNTTNSGEKLQILKNIYLAAELHMADYLLMDNANQIRFRELNSQGTHYVALQGPGSLSATSTLTLPEGAGTSGQSMRTEGNGVLSWADTPTALFGINAHASWDGSAAGSFDWSTDKVSEGNITSVTRTAIGKFTVTFDRDFSSNGYTAICTAGAVDHAGITAGGRTVAVLSRSAGSMDIVCERADDGANDDSALISIMVIGTLS